MCSTAHTARVENGKRKSTTMAEVFDYSDPGSYTFWKDEKESPSAAPALPSLGDAPLRIPNDVRVQIEQEEAIQKTKPSEEGRGRLAFLYDLFDFLTKDGESEVEVVVEDDVDDNIDEDYIAWRLGYEFDDLCLRLSDTAYAGVRLDDEEMHAELEAHGRIPERHEVSSDDADADADEEAPVLELTNQSVPLEWTGSVYVRHASPAFYFANLAERRRRDHPKRSAASLNDLELNVKPIVTVGSSEYERIDERYYFAFEQYDCVASNLLRLVQEAQAALDNEDTATARTNLGECVSNLKGIFGEEHKPTLSNGTL